MKTLIAVPCMDMMHTRFVASLIGLKMGEDYEVRLGASSLVYETRNSMLRYALENGFDRIIQFDSDMTFDPYVLTLLQEDLDRGIGIVSGLCFKRKPPYTPAIFDRCELVKHEGGKLEPVARCYYDYPEDSIFEIAACGGACVAMDMHAVKNIVEAFGMYLYMPVAGFGEDLSFCMRAREAGQRVFCDSRIKLGHVGDYVYDENMYKKEDFINGKH